MLTLCRSGNDTCVCLAKLESELALEMARLEHKVQMESLRLQHGEALVPRVFVECHFPKKKGPEVFDYLPVRELS